MQETGVASFARVRYTERSGVRTSKGLIQVHRALLAMYLLFEACANMREAHIASFNTIPGNVQMQWHSAKRSVTASKHRPTGKSSAASMSSVRTVGMMRRLIYFTILRRPTGCVQIADTTGKVEYLIKNFLGQYSYAPTRACSV